MGQRSKVDLLPEEIRKELEQRLIAGGFSNYEGLVGWLKENGCEISKSGLHRWGSTLEERCAGLKTTTAAARAIVEASPDNEGAMGIALTRLIQDKLFTVLLDLEIDPEIVDVHKLGRMIADLSRASVTQQKHASEVRRQAREEQLAEQSERLASIVKEGGVSEEVAETFRRQILGAR